MLIARHFGLDGPLGNSNYYAIRVEIQVRGSPHIQSFIWILNSPKLTSSAILEYTEWLDSIIRTDLPTPNTEPRLCEIVKTYQIHRHSKTCRRYKVKYVDLILEDFYYQKSYCCASTR